MKIYNNIQATINKEVSIDSTQVKKILWNELESILGGSGRYILKGEIFETDYRFKQDDYIRDASVEEVSLYNAFHVVMGYYNHLK